MFSYLLLLATAFLTYSPSLSFPQKSSNLKVIMCYTKSKICPYNSDTDCICSKKKEVTDEIQKKEKERTKTEHIYYLFVIYFLYFWG